MGKVARLTTLNLIQCALPFNSLAFGQLINLKLDHVLIDTAQLAHVLSTAQALARLNMTYRTKNLITDFASSAAFPSIQLPRLKSLWLDMPYSRSEQLLEWIEGQGLSRFYLCDAFGQSQERTTVSHPISGSPLTYSKRFLQRVTQISSSFGASDLTFKLRSDHFTLTYGRCAKQTIYKLNLKAVSPLLHTLEDVMEAIPPSQRNSVTTLRWGCDSPQSPTYFYTFSKSFPNIEPIHITEMHHRYTTNIRPDRSDETRRFPSLRTLRVTRGLSDFMFKKLFDRLLTTSNLALIELVEEPAGRVVELRERYPDINWVSVDCESYAPFL